MRRTLPGEVGMAAADVIVYSQPNVSLAVTQLVIVVVAEIETSVKRYWGGRRCYVRCRHQRSDAVVGRVRGAP